MQCVHEEFNKCKITKEYCPLTVEGQLITGDIISNCAIYRDMLDQKLKEYKIEPIKKQVLDHHRVFFLSETIIVEMLACSIYTVEGLTYEEGKETFFSTAHGAGRVMSRHAAMKKFRGEDVIRNLAAQLTL